ncbi:unnamed protein product [Closterium sp. NIES-54]
MPHSLTQHHPTPQHAASGSHSSPAGLSACMHHTHPTPMPQICHSHALHRPAPEHTAPGLPSSQAGSPARKRLSFSLPPPPHPPPLPPPAPPPHPPPPVARESQPRIEQGRIG